MAQAELAPPIAVVPQPRANWSRPLIAVSIMLLALVGGVIVGGPLGRFALGGLTYAPVILLAGLLHLRRWKVARVISWIWFWLMVLGIAGVSIALTLASSEPIRRLDPQRAVGPSLLMLAVLVVGVVVAATPAWRTIARAAGARVDGEHPAHAQGTVGLLVGSALAFAPLILLGGHAPLVEVLNRVDVSSVGMTEQLIDEISSVAWTIVLVFWAAGFPVRATLAAARERLGLTRLRKRDIVPLVAIALLLVGFGSALDFANSKLFTQLGWPLTDGGIITRLMSVATTPLGAIIIAACAGLSEELLFRGLLQPRFGWLLANIGFVGMHAFQYGADGLVSVFVIGAALAFVRARWNTSASIGVHFGYDMILLLLAQLGF